ncbi:carboxymuconolactone decarboxylase family protein [Mycobacterium botniense]|uniref:4-carboxymuconolactone decarboxylase n=1 Tax=Mycobacterium botniense TaxID=84962 RepID=A0A7I9XTT2_9MYCO|nr:carboxymuconolactone decarboxylase family protein [Mycobacterium botniense]GFG73421.1 4-carboxymuconolactone decarboxylase [Mycobacterium botniense]
MTGTSKAEQTGRIPAGGLRELGLVNWILAKLGARTVRAPQMHLFTTLGQHKRLFWLWLPYSGALLRGRLPRADTELVILRVAHLRGCEYELQHHRRMARRRGLDDTSQDAIFSWPHSSGSLSPRQRALLAATDEFVTTRSVSEDAWKQLSNHLDRRQLIEFCMLAGQYDGLAATMSALEIPLDHPGHG